MTQEIITLLEKQDPIACNVCQTVLRSLKRAEKLWLVVHSDGFKAIVRAPHISAAKTSAHYGPDVEVFEIDPDSINVPYQDSQFPNCIMTNRSRDW